MRFCSIRSRLTVEISFSLSSRVSRASSCFWSCCFSWLDASSFYSAMSLPISCSFYTSYLCSRRYSYACDYS